MKANGTNDKSPLMTARSVQDQAIPNDASMLSMHKGSSTPAVDLGERQYNSQLYGSGRVEMLTSSCHMPRGQMPRKSGTRP